MIGKLRRGGVIPAGVCPLPTITGRAADNYTHEAHRILDHDHPRGRLDRSIYIRSERYNVAGRHAVYRRPPDPTKWSYDVVDPRTVCEALIW